MGFEEPERVTSRSREVGEGRAPGGRLGRACYDVGRFSAAREKEDGYPACVPFHCQNVVRQDLRARGEGWGRVDVLAYIPPPLSLKADPNELGWLARTPQPWLPVLAAAQSAPVTTLPVMPREDELVEDIRHPGSVWSVTWLWVFSWIPSTMSISPPAGQLGPGVESGRRSDWGIIFI